MIPSELEAGLVDLVKAAQLPALKDWTVEALGAQVDLDDDQLLFTTNTLLIACVGADLDYPGGDRHQVAFAVVVPGSDQQLRRQQAMDALVALRAWLSEATPLQPNTVRTERLHPVVVAGLFATYVG